MRINLITDEGSVSKKDHTALKEELEKVGYSIKEKRSDMGAKGGYHWFPVGLVLYVAVEFLGGFSKRMGQRFADAILKLIENIKNRGHYQKPEVCLQTNLKMDYGKLIVYFVFDREQEYTYTDIQTALKPVYKSCEDL
ncbi:hypothetical protein JKY72_05565, partial [Candidatus Gracilibacteria bacterium]|nr:hypothetical protein [Candidatus Gracilibacteria bacterium]